MRLHENPAKPGHDFSYLPCSARAYPAVKVQSKIIKTMGKEIVKKVSTEPKKVHHLITSDLDLSHDITYQIFLGNNGKPTVEKKLKIK